MRTLFVTFCIFVAVNAVPTHVGNKAHKVSPKGRIVGGKEAAEHEAPYYVTIHAKGPTRSEFCGGTIISKKYVLTAAHCLDTMYYNEITAGVHRLGEMTDHRMMFANSTFYIHEKYNATNVHNDLALIKLDYPIQVLNEDVQIVKLPKRSEANIDFVGETARLYGRGDTRDDQPSTDETQEVRYVDVPIISNNACQNGGIPDAEIYDGNLCTSGAGSKGACVGDSGGPLIYKGVMIGAVSFGDSPCKAGRPTVFTKIGKYLDWIAAHSDAKIEN